MITYCSACDGVHAETRKQEPWRWRCIHAPVEPGFFFVDPDYSPVPPYALCRFVNHDGDCTMFEPVRQVEKSDG